jgi:hypothetical protein
MSHPPNQTSAQHSGEVNVPKVVNQQGDSASIQEASALSALTSLSRSCKYKSFLSSSYRFLFPHRRKSHPHHPFLNAHHHAHRPAMALSSPITSMPELPSQVGTFRFLDLPRSCSSKYCVKHSSPTSLKSKTTETTKSQTSAARPCSHWLVSASTCAAWLTRSTTRRAA